jgi:spore coat protein A, manganese oxidase
LRRYFALQIVLTGRLRGTAFGLRGAYAEGCMRRRDFIRVSGALGITAFVHDRLGLARQLFAHVAGGILDSVFLPKFQTPVLVPPAMPRAGKVVVRRGKNIDYYEIAVRQFDQQILPAGYPKTTVWGYGPKTARGGPIIFNAPSLTIEATYNKPVRIKWINELMDVNGTFLPHLLPVDPTLHWANPPGGTAQRDTRPTFAETPGDYRGPVPIVTHVHGAAGVGDESDGYAEAWFLPDATDIPAGYATTGTWYDFFSNKAATKFKQTWTPGSATFEYPNAHRASTLWYHDHALGMTRLNVYAGPAGFFILRGGPQEEAIDVRTGAPAILPGPAPSQGDAPGLTYYEIPLAIQDRSFRSDGSLFYPDRREFFDEIEGPYIPHTDVSPIWNPEFFGSAIIVNGRTWPYLDVEQRRYRFRLLNGCQSRFLILDFSHIPGIEVWLIGNEGGLLPAPVDVVSVAAAQLLMGPAERFDVIVDFGAVPTGEYTLTNVGPDEPFGGGAPGQDFPVADPLTTGLIMQFRVRPTFGQDTTTPAAFVQLPPIVPLPNAAVTRHLGLFEEMSENFPDAPAAALLGRIVGDPNAGPGTWEEHMWKDEVTENPSVGTTETWELYNNTADAHPMHIHETTFEVVNRQNIIADEGNETVVVDSESAPAPPEPWEAGRKDTVIAYPGQVTRVKMRFDTPGQYVWHCHIVEHEDNEMMRPYRVGPVQSGQPGDS